MIKRKIMSYLLASTIVLGTGSFVMAAGVDELPNISDNSLVIGKNLFKLDTVTNSIYNLNTFVKASKTVDENNGVYYKYNGKWYTGQDIESFEKLKTGTPVDSIKNDIESVNGQSAADYKNNNFSFDWYQDGDYSHDKDGENESVEQFVVVFNQKINPNKGKLKIIVPDNTKADPYGAGKLGEITVDLENDSTEQSLANVEGGKPVTCFLVKTKENTDRVILELTEDWTRILNTEKTGINYYDKRVSGLKLVAEGLEDSEGNKISNGSETGEITAKSDINLVKDNQKPKVVYDKPIYTYIGENGMQPAGSTRIVFNEPVQIFTEKMISELKDANTKLPEIITYNPLTPSQQQLETNKDGLPVFSAEYHKVGSDGKDELDKDGKPIVIKGEYGLMGDIMKKDAESKENGEKIAFRIDQIPFDYDFDPKNEGITRFRDIGAYLINPETTLTEGKWKLVVKNFTDEAGNTMDEYVSDVIDIKPYFTIEKLTKDGIKIKFTEPFKGNKIFGGRVPILVYNSEGKMVAYCFIDNIKEGQTEAEGKFLSPIENLEGTYDINNMEYTVTKEESQKDNGQVEKNQEDKTQEENDKVDKSQEDNTEMDKAQQKTQDEGQTSKVEANDESKAE